MRILSLGDRGREVSDVQQRLFALGHELGGEGLDGFFGPKTLAALKSFQQRRGLIVDGTVGANTWRELVEAGYSLGERLLYLREPPLRGDDVLALQVKLNLLGFNAGPERGIFDEGVERAVLDFQRNAGLPLDGIVGRSTLTKLDALRKAETGREGKKIPERDEGYVAARSLTGQIVVIDPGHGGADTGVISPNGLKEKDRTLAIALRAAELLRAEGSRAHLTRERDDSTDVYARTEFANVVRADYFLSIHFGGNASPLAAGGACYYFQRNHYYSEHGQRLAGYVGDRLPRLHVPFNGAFGRNFAVLREPVAISVVVEPLFLTNPAEEALAARPSFVDRAASAIVDGLAAYLARSACPADTRVSSAT